MNANKQDAGGLPEPVAHANKAQLIGVSSADSAILGRNVLLSRSKTIKRTEPLYTADQMRAYGELCRAAPAGGDEDSLFTPAEHLAACREDWQRVCDALGANGQHMDPDDVLKAIGELSAPAGSGEDAYVIEQMGRLLAEIAVIVNGPEPARTRWSYHDLPEKVRALQEQRVASPEIPFLATPMTDYSEGSRLRWEYEKGWNACREYALRAISRGVPEGMVLVPVEPTREMLDAAGEVVFRNVGEVWAGEGFAEDLVRETQKQCWAAAIAAQRKEGG